jgi:hypothetical protein
VEETEREGRDYEGKKLRELSLCSLPQYLLDIISTLHIHFQNLREKFRLTDGITVLAHMKKKRNAQRRDRGREGERRMTSCLGVHWRSIVSLRIA